MDVVQIFNDELQSLFETKPPVSKAKMGQITRAAMKGVKFYKHIVQSVEKFIAKCRSEYKVPGLYVVDSIVRQSRHQFGVERDVYAARFARNLQVTFNNLFSGCHNDDKPKIVRVLNLWQKNGVFDAQIIAPLLDMANPGASLTMASESTLSANSPALETNKHAQTSKYIVDHFNNSNNNRGNSSPTSRKPQEGGLRFSKNMLDFDYDEDDDGDETPTEAEPPLSSTLSKIEMEHRGKRSGVDGDTSQTSHMNQQSVSIQLGYTRSDQDPVLERWNRLIKPQAAPGLSTNEHTTVNHSSSSANSHKRLRSRSRSPSRSKHDDSRRKEHHHQSHSSSSSSRSKDVNSKSLSAEKEAERAKKCLPKIRDKHLTVCSSTLWLGHVPKTISEADISDAFGEYGTINSIDLIPPRGCAYVCMDRRQDAKKALSESRDLKLNGSHIKMAWAPGKGFKEYKKLKDFWEVDVGASYIPYNKLDSSIDFDVLEEGGVIDEDSMSAEMKETRERRARERSNKDKEGATSVQPSSSTSLTLTTSLPPPTLPILNQPPPFTMPPPNLGIPPPTALMGGAIPFPPPHVANLHQIPPPAMGPAPSGAFDPANPNGGQQQEQRQQQDPDELNSPTAIDQQLSMTKRQISMVEQQLSMIEQAQNLGHHQPPLAPVIPTQIAAQAIFSQNQPNSFLFDPQFHHLQPQIPIFNPQVIGHSMNGGQSQMPPYSHHQ